MSIRKKISSLVLALGLAASWSQGASADLVRAPYLQSVSTDSVIVAWRTTEAYTDSVVRFGLTQDALTDLALRPDPETEATYPVARGSNFDHFVKVDGLAPGTLYYYSIGSAAAVDPEAGGDATHYFQTAPVVGSTDSFSFWVVGDSGNNGSAAHAVRDAMLEHFADGAPELFLHAGDMAYNSGTDTEFTNNFFDVYSSLFSRSALWPTIGNHEAVTSTSGVVGGAAPEGPYYEAFHLPTDSGAAGSPSGTEAYYSFDYGNMHVVVLDSHDSDTNAGSIQLQWLEADLAGMPASQTWLVAFFHHPPYTKGSHDSDSSSDSGGRMIRIRENALPILESAGVDLVLSGHSHNYERSFLIDGYYSGTGTIIDGTPGYPAPYEKPPGLVGNQGTVYVVAGHGGASLSQKSSKHPVMHAWIKESGATLVNVSDNQLVLENIDVNDEINDRFTLQKGPTSCLDVADCDDFSLCTTDACTDGFCEYTDLVCDEGQECNVDDGECVYPPVVVSFQHEVAGYEGVTDTFLAQHEPAVAQNAEEYVGWDTETTRGDADSVSTALIHFDSIFESQGGSLPDGVEILSATLTLTVNNSGDDAVLWESAVSWPAAVTYETFGGDASVSLGAELGTVVADSTGALELDVTESLRSWTTDPALNLGWVIVPTDTDGVQARSSEYDPDPDEPDLALRYAARPLLVVEYVADISCEIEADCGSDDACVDYSCTDEICSSVSTVCEDNDACTANVCDSVSGCDFPVVSCDDSDLCTIDACDIVSGCSNEPVVCDAGYECEAETGACVVAPVLVTFQNEVDGYDGGLDTYIREDNPDTSYGDEDLVIFDQADDANAYYGLLRFERLFVSQGGIIPDGAVIDSASVIYDVQNAGVTAGSLREAQVAWNEDSTFNSFGPEAGVQSEDYGADLGAVSGVEGLASFDATASLIAWAANPSSNQGWLLLPSSDDSIRISSSDGDTAPILQVSYFLPIAQACTADEECVAANECMAGACVAETCDFTVLSCDDANACTIESCDTETGCASVALSCDDGDNCTDDTCDAELGCANTVVECAEGQECNPADGSCIATTMTLSFQQGVEVTEGADLYAGAVDTFINQDEANDAAEAGETAPTHGSDAVVEWDEGTLADKISLLRFGNLFAYDGGPIPTGSTIVSATLTYMVDDAGDEGELYESFVDWDEDVLYSDIAHLADGMPAEAYGNLNTELLVADSVGDEPVIDVTASIVRWAFDPAANKGWMVLPTGSGGVDLASAEATDAAERPKLTIVFSPPGDCADADECAAGNACTAASCSDTNSCEYEYIACADNAGDACLVDSCDPASGCVAEPLNCDDGNECTVDSCASASGCANTAVVCEDNSANACIIDSCDPELGCVSAPADCDDGDACTVDACDETDGCSHTAVVCETGVCSADTGECGAPEVLATFQQGVASYEGTVDTYIYQNSENASYGTDIVIRMDESGSRAYYGLLRFESLFVSEGGSIPDGATIKSARVIYDVSDDGDDGVVHHPLVAWDGTTTYASFGEGFSEDNYEADGQPYSGDPDTQEFDATDSLNEWSSDPASNNGWIFVPGGRGGVQFSSSEGSTPPLLEVIYFAVETGGGCESDTDCDDSNVCTDDVCDEGGACSNTANTASCDDGNACTTADVCSSGTCGGEALSCDDGNACNGAESCDEATGCEAGTALSCDDGNACNGAESCDEATGCVVGEALSCDDGDVCNGTESCDEATGCVAGTVLSCDDGDVCTDDSCGATSGCANIENEEPGCVPECDVDSDCNDGSACTTNTCVAGACEMAVVTCDDGNACNGAESCDEATGCVAGEALSCDDGNACNGTESCNEATGCEAGEALSCDDGNACNGAESCDEATGCVAGEALSCDDGNACNGTESCDATTGCEAGTALSCDDGNACNGAESCDDATGCVVGEALSCDDGNVCNGAESCDEATGCVAGTVLSCDDGDVCTDDSCGATSGCANAENDGPGCIPECAVDSDCNDGSACTTNTCVAGICEMAAVTCDDGNMCNGTESCNAATGCVAGTALSCDDGNACNGTESCDAATGCVAGEALSCDDGNACNGTESCNAATGCTSGTPVNCDDGNACTDDTCGAGGTCSNVNNTASCDDGNACTSGDVCGGGSCGGSAVTCDDSDVCTDDSCQPSTGSCVFAENDGPGCIPECEVDSDCDDGSACTTNSCVAGVCEMAAVTCDDGNACNGTESCDEAMGCVAGEALSCDDGNACNGTESCDAVTGCAAGEALSCDDGNACNGTESCDAVTGCAAGEALSCDDGDVCTDDSCEASSGGCVFAENDGPGCVVECQSASDCDDGNACTDEVCTAEGTCESVDIVCDDGNECTDDSCDPESGCTAANNSASCDDGAGCTEGDTCSDGSCEGTELDCSADVNECQIGSCDGASGQCLIQNAPPGTECSAGSCLAGQCIDTSDCSVANVAHNTSNGGLPGGVALLLGAGALALIRRRRGGASQA